MFEFWFDCTALEISTTTKILNDILFPVVLFVLIFWLMCDIFLTDNMVDDNLSSMSESLSDDTIATQEDNYSLKVTNNENQHKTEIV
ncbi:hypothetical protein NIES4101_36250 [Calothrix sp. NIES-4101]|nr:hypothetical protein NIES4101_36250 [Calothrix sp. NIES-4101]